MEFLLPALHLFSHNQEQMHTASQLPLYPSSLKLSDNGNLKLTLPISAESKML